MSIDAVITWVNGADPAHAAKLAYWRRRSGLAPHVLASASDPHRFASDREIVYCLRSIRRHAPWIRTIWLVTDDQVPEELDRRVAEQNGIRVIDHRHVFRGLEELLPTFNSIAIETLMWRIEGLADRFIFFNDDMFLAHPANPGDFFKEDRLVLRGKTVDWSAGRPTAPYLAALYNAAILARHDVANLFLPSHVPHPIFREKMRALYEKHYLIFLRNAATRFRTTARVHPVGLLNFTMMAAGRSVIRKARRTTYIGTGICRTGTAEELRRLMDKVEDPIMLSFCVNDLTQLAARLPDARARIERLVGPRQPWERRRTDTAPIEELPLATFP